MKKTLFLAAAALGLTTAASAQKNIDLALTSYIPVSNTNYANVNQGDTVYAAVKIVNNGTESVTPTDTVEIVFDLWMLDQPGYQIARQFGNLTIAPNDSVLVALPFINGVTQLTSNAGNMTMEIKQNHTYDSTTIFGYGFDVNGNMFNDPDIDLAQGIVSGNNVDVVTNFTFGTPGNNTTVNELATATLNVYPNPTSNNINFTHNFAKATTATVKVLDLMGRVVMTEQYDVNAGAKNFNLNVADLANGSYFVELTTSEEKGITKFTIAK